MMRVTMLLDMNDKRHNNDRYMVSKIIGVDITCVPRPSHVAPSMAATMDVYPRPGRNDGLDLVVPSGPARKFRLAVVWVTAASAGAEESHNPSAAPVKTPKRSSAISAPLARKA